MSQLFDTRPYRPEDFDFANGMIEANMGRYFVMYDRVWEVESFRQNMTEGVNRVIICDGEACGFYQYVITETSAKLNFINLDAAHQGKGIGTAVMNALEEELSHMGMTEIRLSVYPANPALKLYLALGYEIVRQEGAKIRMVKKL